MLDTKYTNYETSIVVDMRAPEIPQKHRWIQDI